MKVIPFTIPVPQGDSLVVKEEWLPYFYPHLHRHAEIQVTAIMKGEGNLLAGTGLTRFTGGDIFVIGPNQPHLFKSDGAGKPNRRKQVHSLTLFFNPAGLSAPLFELPEMNAARRWLKAASGAYKIPQQQMETARELLLRIRDSSGLARVGQFIALLQIMMQLKPVHSIGSFGHPPSFSESEGQRLNQIYRYSLEHFREPVSLAQVAGIAHLTIPAFCKYFKKRTGKTYLRFLNELRIAEAGRLLQSDPEAAISEIAASSGFRHVTHFNRMFRQIAGSSPSSFREKSL